MEKLKAWAKAVELAPLGVVITATAGCVALGVLFGWILFGRPHLITSTEKIGTVAEWAAAVGTWVIGLAAAWYANEAHILRMNEVRGQRKREIIRDTARLRRIEYRCTKIKFVDIPLQTQNSPIAVLSENRLRRASTRIAGYLTESNWSDEELGVMDDAMVTEHEKLTHACGLLKKQCEAILQSAPENDAPLSNASQALLKTLRERADRVMKLSTALDGLAKKARKKARKDLNELSKHLH